MNFERDTFHPVLRCYWIKKAKERIGRQERVKREVLVGVELNNDENTIVSTMLGVFILIYIINYKDYGQ